MIRHARTDDRDGEHQKAMRNRILRRTTYAAFRRALTAFDCRLCALHSGRTHLVVDRGNPEASLLLIGEGPGAEEDRKGRAFVGASGKLLDEMLREAGLEPDEDLLIANVVKCRPPDNRPPKREEVDCCLPFLRRQIELVRPRCITLLGATAVRHIFPDKAKSSMKQLAGRFFRGDEFPNCEILISFHPAYILRNRTKRGEMVGHLRNLAKRWVES